LSYRGQISSYVLVVNFGCGSFMSILPCCQALPRPWSVPSVDLVILCCHHKEWCSMSLAVPLVWLAPASCFFGCLCVSIHANPDSHPPDVNAYTFTYSVLTPRLPIMSIRRRLIWTFPPQLEAALTCTERCRPCLWESRGHTRVIGSTRRIAWRRVQFQHLSDAHIKSVLR
jgi:hypothetical protein